MMKATVSQQYEPCNTAEDIPVPLTLHSGRPAESVGEQIEQGSSSGLSSILKSCPLLSILLIFVPCSFATYWTNQPDWVIFSCSFFAVLPLAWLIGTATEDIAKYTGEAVGGLVNATFGNIVEMLLCVAAIRQNELSVVKCTLIGSMLSNMLLVLGMALIWGGYKNPPPKKMSYSTVSASAQTTLMLLGAMGVVLPTVYSVLAPGQQEETVLDISRGCASLMLVVYFQYLFFQLRTHKSCFESDDSPEDDKEGPIMSTAVAVGLLAVCTIVTAFCSEYIVSSLGGTIRTWNVSKEFIAIILLPIIGNAAEHYTAISVAGHNKMDLSLGVAVGSSCQMALLVTPFTVLCGWMLDKPMTLDFHIFQVTVLLFSILIVSNVLKDGESNWLEGSMLVTAYCAIALIYYTENGEFGLHRA